MDYLYLSQEDVMTICGFKMPSEAKSCLISKFRRYSSETVLEVAAWKKDCGKITNHRYKEIKKIIDSKEKSLALNAKVLGNYVKPKVLAERLSISSDLARKFFKGIATNLGLYPWVEVVRILDSQKVKQKQKNVTEEVPVETHEDLMERFTISLHRCFSDMRNILNSGLSTDMVKERISSIGRIAKQEHINKLTESVSCENLEFKDIEGKLDYAKIGDFLNKKGLIGKTSVEIEKILKDQKLSLAAITRAKRVFKNPNMSRRDLMGSSKRKLRKKEQQLGQDSSSEVNTK